VDDLLERRDARLGRGQRGPQPGHVAGAIIRAVGMVLGHGGIVADPPASGQAKAARRGITLP
jgi:hypothetical protein